MNALRGYAPSFGSVVLDVLDAVVYGLYRLVKGVLWVAFPLGIVGAVYLAPIALLWALYRWVAGYFFPDTWSVVLREPAFWPVVALVTLGLLLCLIGMAALILIRGGGATLTIRFPYGDLKLWWKKS